MGMKKKYSLNGTLNGTSDQPVQLTNSFIGGGQPKLIQYINYSIDHITRKSTLKLAVLPSFRTPSQKGVKSEVFDPPPN